MKHVGRILRRDLRRLLRNPVAVVITLGVCVIPSLYAWYNIAANWDPYGNTEGVRIAVANEDRGVRNDVVGELDAGAQTIDRLRENGDLGWVFTSATEAEEGVRRGDYYAAIVIPSDFSERLASVLTGEFKQPELTYLVNEKKNAIAPKVTDTGAETIEEQINETFVSTVSKTLVEEARQRGIELESHVNSTEEGILAHVDAALEDVARVREPLASVGETIETAKVGIADAQRALAQAQGAAPTLTKALEQSDELMATARAAARDASQSLATTLSSGAAQLGSAAAHANSAVGTVAGAVSEAKLKIDIGLSNAQAVIDANTDLINLLREIDETGHVTGLLTGHIDKLQEQTDNAQHVKDALQAQSNAMGQDADAVHGATSALADAVNGGTEGLGALQQQLTQGAAPQLESGLDALSTVSRDLAGAVSGLKPVGIQASAALDQMGALLDQAKTPLKSVDDLLGNVEETLGSVKADIAAMRGTAAAEGIARALDMDAADISEFMSSPAVLATKVVYPVENYGSGVTPFYTNLALWVGGFVLIAIFKLEVDAEGIDHMTAREAYFGRWMLMVVLGIVQALIVCLGDLALGIQCGQPLLFVLAGVFVSFVYVNIIYALAVTFKHIGKAIGVLLVIVQIPGSSGMYPIEMMPAFFRAIHPLLPFTYGINAMRETIGGMYGADYLQNLGALAIFLACSLVLGVWVRPLLSNLNALFDRELSQTGVMLGEHDRAPRTRLPLRAMLSALLDTEAFCNDVVTRSVRFERRYRRRVRFAFLLVLFLPVVLFAIARVLDAGIDTKLTMLVVWIAVVVIADGCLIALEYARQSLRDCARLSVLGSEEIRACVEQARGEGDEA